MLSSSSISSSSNLLVNPNLNTNQTQNLVPIQLPNAQQMQIPHSIQNQNIMLSSLINNGNQSANCGIISNVEQKTMAAPYPALPTRQTIEVLLEEIIKEIRKLKSELKNLERKKALGDITVPPISSKKPELKVQNAKGMLIPQQLVSEIQRESFNRATQSHSKYFCSNRFLYNNIALLPNYCSTVSKHEELCEPMFQVIVGDKAALVAKEHSLVKEYFERKSKWIEMCKVLDEFHEEAKKALDIWPKEFAVNIHKQTEAQFLAGVGKDQPMFLTSKEKEMNIWYSENGFVADPQREHQEYKARVTWTEAEKQLFIEKYAQHPRDFKKIAAGIQSKTIKDVIEYYNIHRIQLNLRDLDAASRKKTGRKKVTTEGTVKK